MTVQQTATDSNCLVRPYGDTLNDGVVQFSFTLPLPHNELACEAARAIGESMGLGEVSLTCSRDLGQSFSFLVLYGKMTSGVDVSRLTVTKGEFETMKKEAIDRYIQEHFGRKLVFLGACIETDAHTVGIDAIMNMKGFNGHKGLESYHEVQAVNLGAQVNSDEFIAKALEMKADALLVSQIVTQKNVHLANLTRLVDIL